MAAFSPRKSLGLAVAIAALAASTTGCGNNDDYAVVVSWAINGLAPTAEVCSFHGIKSVRLKVADGARERTVEGECGRTLILSDGYDYGGFVTTEWFVFGVSYSYQLDMIADNGDILINGSGTFGADYSDQIPGAGVELPTLDYFSPRAVGGEIATVTGSFSVGGGTDLAQGCASAGVNRVELWVYSVLDFDLVAPDRVLYADCAAGTLDSGTPLLNPGDYQITYVALDYGSEAAYTVVDSTDPIPVVVDQAGTVTLPAEQLAVP